MCRQTEEEDRGYERFGTGEDPVFCLFTGQGKCGDQMYSAEESMYKFKCLYLQSEFL